MAQSGSDPVDIHGFREAMRAAGVEEIVGPTLSVYREEARQLFDTLVAAAAAWDAEGVRAAAHALKSSSGNIRAHRASSLFASVEGAASENDLTTVRSTLRALEPEFARVMTFLREAEVAR